MNKLTKLVINPLETTEKTPVKCTKMLKVSYFAEFR